MFPLLHQLCSMSVFFLIAFVLHVAKALPPALWPGMNGPVDGTLMTASALGPLTQPTLAWTVAPAAGFCNDLVNDGGFVGGVIGYDGTLYAPTWNNSLLAVVGKDGSIRWQQNFANSSIQSICVPSCLVSG